MSVHLQRIRVTHTTSRQSDAGTDNRVDLRFFIDPHPWTTYPFKGWRSLQLDLSRDDRQRGATESYELDLTEGSLGISVSGTIVPRDRVPRFRACDARPGSSRSAGPTGGRH